MTADTPGKRVYLIRLALGDGFKTPMPMASFATLLTKRSGVTYDSSMISRMESGDRKVTLEDAPRLAVVDPQQRGAAWIAWGDEQAPTEAGAVDIVDEDRDRPLTDAEIERARRAVAAKEAAARATPARKRGGSR